VWDVAGQLFGAAVCYSSLAQSSPKEIEMSLGTVVFLGSLVIAAFMLWADRNGRRVHKD